MYFCAVLKTPLLRFCPSGLNHVTDSPHFGLRTGLDGAWHNRVNEKSVSPNVFELNRAQEVTIFLDFAPWGPNHVT